MKEIRSKSYSEKKASLGESMSRGFGIFSRMTNHPLWGSFWKGTHLDAKSGLLGQGLQSLERAGVTDKEGRELASVTRDMVSLIDATKPDCYNIPESLKDVLEQMHVAGNPLLRDYQNKSRAWRKWCFDNFDYRFGPFARAYTSYINKHTDEIGKVDDKAEKFADSQMSLLFESVYNLSNRIIAAHGTSPGAPLCP